MSITSHLPFLSALSPYLNVDDNELHRTILLVIAAPLIWNIVARSIRSTLPSSTSPTIRYLICYALAIWIFAFSLYRDMGFHSLIASQPHFDILSSSSTLRTYLSYALLGVGQLFVQSSFFQLGITGTFLGDYCGIFMRDRVTGFPFNVLENPMYVGSTLSFLGYSLLNASPAGLLITAEVALVYKIALVYEGSYTTQIYIERDAARKIASSKAE